MMLKITLTLLTVMLVVGVMLLSIGSPDRLASAPPPTVTYNGTLTGVINGAALSGTVSAIADSTTGAIPATITLSSVPPQFHPAQTGISFLSISCINNAKEEDGGINFFNMLGGAGTYSFQREYTYPNHPGNSLTVSGTATLASGVLTYVADWNGNVTGVPDDIVELRPYVQTLTPVASGIVDLQGSAKMVRSGGEVIPLSWTGQYDFGLGNDLPFDEISAFSTSFTFDGTVLNLPDAVSTIRPGSVGGTVELLGQSESPGDASESSARDYTAPIAAVAAAGVVVLAAAGWYARRRWMR